ncbi:MAG: hypothetical protein Q8Q47_12435, partial [Ignavibacteriaceae bacterium]|nr:hypothetical protein [Ignavibacteriaceae bacterium]
MSESILVIEEKRTELQNYLYSGLSPYKKLTSLNNFFSLLLAINNNHILKAYGSDLIDQYCSLLVESDIWCSHPAQDELILTTAEKLLSLKAFNIADNRLKKGLVQFQYKVDELTAVLNGKDAPASEINKYYFPLIDNTNKSGQLYGMLDSISIKITKGKEQKFHIIPSEKEIEARIKSQVEISWNVALHYSKRFIKGISSQHEVIISFDKRVGFYVGDSLGVALTLAYINELFFFYNAPLTITAKESCCFTGRISHNGETPSIGCENITKKIELIFYSGIKTFVIPKADETAAEEKLRKFKVDYPQRNLKLITISDIEDLLNRRNAVEIKKLSILKRTGRTIARNKLVTLLLFVMIGLLSSYFLYEYDDNPATLDLYGTTLYVKNKTGKVLWTKNQVFIGNYFHIKNFRKNFCRIIDIDNDGINEVLVAFEELPGNEKERGRLTCYNYNGILRWKYFFSDTVKTKRELFTENWNSSIMFDTASIDGRKILICSNSNNLSFANAIYKLDLLTGKRLPGTLWHVGHCSSGFVKDLNNDGVQELIVIGTNNSFDHARIIFVLQVTHINGYAPSTEEYRFYEFPPADLLVYVKIPQTDLSTYFEMRCSMIEVSSLHDRNDIRKIVFSSIEAPDGSNVGGLIYILDYNLKDFNVVVSSAFAY